MQNRRDLETSGEIIRGKAGDVRSDGATFKLLDLLKFIAVVEMEPSGTTNQTALFASIFGNQMGSPSLIGCINRSVK